MNYLIINRNGPRHRTGKIPDDVFEHDISTHIGMAHFVIENNQWVMRTKEKKFVDFFSQFNNYIIIEEPLTDTNESQKKENNKSPITKILINDDIMGLPEEPVAIKNPAELFTTQKQKNDKKKSRKSIDLIIEEL